MSQQFILGFFFKKDFKKKFSVLSKNKCIKIQTAVKFSDSLLSFTKPLKRVCLTVESGPLQISHTDQETLNLSRALKLSAVLLGYNQLTTLVNQQNPNDMLCYCDMSHVTVRTVKPER